jgi:hypothetical protein
MGIPHAFQMRVSLVVRDIEVGVPNGFDVH